MTSPAEGGDGAPRAADPVLLLRAAGRSLLLAPRAAAWVLPVAWMALVWWLSARPGDADEGWSLPAWVGRFLANLAHPFAFGLLALWWVPLLPRTGAGARRWVAWSRGRAAAVLAAVVAYGVLDETHQMRVPGRTPSVLDLLSDAVGAACVLATVAYLSRADASRAGVLRRLGLALLACVAAAALSTAGDEFLPGGLWPLP